ncbi:MAG: DUF815 domain-containing protein [Candidatus Gracilibacteria bacterium]|nr:DUF815 domain-containing protein [Candidatus Gracilibacteria bacterium]
MNNEDIEIITPKELIKNITKTNTKDDYEKYDNFFTNINFDKHRKLYKDLVLNKNNFYDKLKEKFEEKINFFGKDKYKFQKEILFKIAENNKKKLGEIETGNQFSDISLKKAGNALNSIYIKNNNIQNNDSERMSLFGINSYINNKSKIDNFEDIFLSQREIKKLLNFIRFISIIPYFGKNYINKIYQKNKEKIEKNLSSFIDNQFYCLFLEIIFSRNKQYLKEFESIDFSEGNNIYIENYNNYFKYGKKIEDLKINDIHFLEILSLKIKFLEKPTTTYLNIFHYLFHYILEKKDSYYAKKAVLKVLKSIIYIDYEYIKNHFYGDEQLVEKTYKDRIYQLLKSGDIKEFELAIDFLVETLKIDTDFLDIYEIISIINKGDQNKTDGILNLFSALIEKNYQFFKDNFLKHFYKLEVNKNSEKMNTLVEEVSKISLEDIFDMIFGYDTGFTEEKEKISIFIKEYTSGSCLLSGYRGVGKSTLIKSIIEKLNKSNENNTEYIDITINIPEQKKDENGITKSFSKKDLMNKIIQQTYLKLKDKGFSSKQLEKLQEQYIRTFKQVEEISGYLKLTKRFGLIRTAIEVLKFSLPVGFGLLSQVLLSKLNISIFGIDVKNIISNPDPLQLLIAGILIILNFLIFRTIFNVNYAAKLERTLYNEDIAEDNFKNNLEILSSKEGIFKSMLIKIINILNIINNLLLGLFKNLFNKNTKKFIIVIDELDKLLDFDKLNKVEDKEKISSMKDIFEILGKLKTLFFEAENILFFVVSNKEAYDYYLANKFQEDDMISNIFNKIIYLPMNDLNQFNLNFKVDIKPKIDNDLKEKIKKYLYFKSHGNWRKASFILGNAIENTYRENNVEKVRINLCDLETFKNEYKFYEFFDSLYKVFEKGSLDEYFDQLGKKSLSIPMAVQSFEEGKAELNNNILLYIIKLLKLQSNEIDKTIDKDNENKFYFSYLENIKNLINYFHPNNFLNINDHINFFIDNKDLTEIEFIGYYAYSINKISNNQAYRDFILNYLLNIYESINNFKIINFQEIFKNIKINENDLDYPAFIDLIILWLPLMLIYFNKIEIGFKTE